MSDPKEARRNILEALRHPPILDFSALNPLALTCVEPDLKRPLKIRTQSPRGRQHPVLVEARKILDRGTSKLEYGRTSAFEWQNHFRFANDRVVRDPITNRHAIQSGKQDMSDDSVNSTKERAQEWFEKELLPCLDGRAKASAYVLGDPGAGKSTLIKYLLNTNAAYLSRSHIVMSRFEFLKFSYRWLGGTTNIKFDLELYISFILLRDIIRTYQYSHFDGERMERVAVGPFSKEQIGTTLRDAASARRVIDQELAHALKDAAIVILEASRAASLDAMMLENVPHDIRVILIAYFSARAEIALVVDGLDCISLEDVQFDTQRADVMQTIVANAQSLTSFSILDRGVPSKTDVPSSTIFVMRENTFYFYRRDNIDIRQTDVPRFYVRVIDPKVAMFNAIARATDKWAVERGLKNEYRDHTRQLLWMVTRIAVRSISKLLHLQPGDGSLDDLFGGNIRTEFKFMERLLDWFLDDAVRTDLLKLDKSTTVADVVQLMAGRNGLRLLRRRNYRIVEVLLYGREGWFENAVVTGPKTEYGRGSDKGDEGSLRDNGNFTGFVDNIFNYHVKEHLPGGNDHRLLEKVRVVQLLRDRFLTEMEIQKALRDRIRFESKDIRKTLMILARSQMVDVHVDRHPDPTFTASRRGLICTLHLAKSMSYLEHTFHRTLFPADLIRHVHDPIRSRGVEEWTIASIRNLFIFLTYLKFVEQNPACGRPVPEAMRIYQATCDRVVVIVERILSSQPVKPGELYQMQGEGAARWEAIALRASRDIDNTIGDWHRLSLVQSVL